MMEPNPGHRPSKLALDRLATGEASPDEQERIEARIDDSARAHLAALDAAKRDLPPLDTGALRRRAAALPPDPVVAAPDVPRPANRQAFGAFLVLLVAAMALFMLADPFAARETADVRFRGGEELRLFELQGRKLFAWDGSPVGQDDVLGFKVVAAGRRGVVVLSVDGSGHVSVFWPEDGDAPEPVEGDGLVALPGTVRLDDAPGPEVFVAVFDRTVSEAKAELEHTFQSGGAEGVLDWAEGAPHVDAVEVPRRILSKGGPTPPAPPE